MENQVLLDVKNLSVRFKTLEGTVTAIDGISFQVNRGEVLCLVGESGCGKSLTSLSIMGLVEKPGTYEAEAIAFEGENIAACSQEQMRKIRGDKISMIFQEPLTSLNPLFTVGNQIDEVFRLHRGMGKKECREKSIEMLKFVGIPAPENVYKRYPGALSGGMRQRVMIAMALSCRPRLLIADEPTTALDVTIQKQILKLMRDLQREFNTSIILITHDLSVVAEMADRVAVMYAGEIVEQASVEKLFAKPLHPYTEGLMKSTIRLGEKSRRLTAIKGTVPSISNMPSGCRFHPRCPYAARKCRTEIPALVPAGEGHLVKCHFAGREREEREGIDG